MLFGCPPSRVPENQKLVGLRGLVGEFQFMAAIVGVLLGIPVEWTATNRFEALTPPANCGVNHGC
jgi:hypothetical protein